MIRMNKQEIIDAAATRYDDKRDCWITESFVDDAICGIADTELASYKIFLEMLDMAWEEFQVGRHGLYSRPGRPAKGKVDLHTQIEPEIKSAIAKLADRIGISQGEAVEYLFQFYQGFKTHTALQAKQPG